MSRPDPTPAAQAADKLRTGLIYSPRYLNHITGEGHPERPERCRAIVDALREAGVEKHLVKIEPRLADAEDILRCHTADYLRLAENEIHWGVSELSTGDTNVCEASFDVSVLAAGGVLAAVDAVIESKVHNAFCVVRPPGHHATANRGMGFCIFNNVAIGARYAQKKHGVGRALIVDWDVHHGNGTQDIFYEDGSVFYFSTHQSPWYPGTGNPDETGAGAGKGCTLNCPAPAGAGHGEIFGAFTERLVPAMKKFKPEFVFISAGFDSRRDDPLGGFVLDDADFADLTRILLDLAREHADGRLVSVLEGGYNPAGLASAATAHVRALRAG
jgi:acetoin utilization deacetylase AcuC-like enzyme